MVLLILCYSLNVPATVESRMMIIVYKYYKVNIIKLINFMIIAYTLACSL